jgi:glycosyltransferase involved in cell wall biosynthesis
VRVLLTVHQFLPDHSSGTEVLTFHVAKELLRLGHEVRIVTGSFAKRGSKRDALVERYTYREVDIHRYRHSPKPSAGSNVVRREYDNRQFASELRQILGDWRPDIIHFFHLKNLSAAAIDVGHELGIPMVLTPTDFWFVCPTGLLLLPNGSVCNGPDREGVNCLRHAVESTQPRAVQRLLRRIPNTLVSLGIRFARHPALAKWRPYSWINALAERPAFLRERMTLLDCVVLPTRLMEEVLLNNGIRPRKVVFSRFGLDLRGFDSAAARYIPTKALRVGFIGSLSPHKGAHVLLSAIRRVPQDWPIEVHLFGDPSTHPDYAQRLIEIAAGDSRIHFRGTFANETIGEVFSAIDVLVVPSTWHENTPLVIYSAHAAGCAVVASDLRGMSEVVRDGVDGMLFPAGDAAALATIMMKLGNDRALLQKLRANTPPARPVSAYVADLVAVYREALADRRARQ